MIWVVIVAVMVAAAALMIYLYQDHIHYLENKIHNLKTELEFTIDCLDAHKEMVEDLEGYYEKWIDAVKELEAVKQQNRKLRLDLMPYQKQTWKQIEESLAEGEMKYI